VLGPANFADNRRRAMAQSADRNVRRAAASCLNACREICVKGGWPDFFGSSNGLGSPRDAVESIDDSFNFVTDQCRSSLRVLGYQAGKANLGHPHWTCRSGVPDTRTTQSMRLYVVSTGLLCGSIINEHLLVCVVRLWRIAGSTEAEERTYLVVPTP
jgi:hypothetical protein